MRGIRVCYKCEDREVGCHSKCERYLKEARKAAIQRELHIKKLEADSRIYDTIEKRRKKKR